MLNLGKLFRKPSIILPGGFCGNSGWQIRSVGIKDIWNDMFKKDIYSFKEVLEVTDNKDADFVHLFYGYGYPDCIYVASQDVNTENPTVFATDHEEWFIEIYDEGDLEKYLQSFWTKEELRDYIEHRMDLWL